MSDIQESYRRLLPTQGRASPGDVPVPVYGDPDSPVVVTFYISPESAEAAEFFEDTFDKFWRQFVDGGAPIAVQLVPVAPEYQHWLSATTADLHGLLKRGEATVSGGLVSELALIVGAEAPENLPKFLKRCCLSGVSTLEREKAIRYAANLGVDEEMARDALSTGKYQPVIGAWTTDWLVPRDGVHTPSQALAVVNGNPIGGVGIEQLKSEVTARVNQHMEMEIEEALDGSGVDAE